MIYCVLPGLIKRHWEYFRHQSKKTTIIGDKMQINQDADPQATFDFTVMSYNILSQDLLEYNPHLYKHCQQQILAWNYRFPNILADIKQLDADVSRKLPVRKLVIDTWYCFY